MSYTVTFKDVGRSKATFSATVPSLDYSALTKAVRPHLASRGIDFEIYDETRHGFVFVGGMRQVGEFTWSEDPGPAARFLAARSEGK